VIVSLHQIVRRSICSLLAVGLLASAVFVAGCADVITYSRDSRQEGLKLYREQQFADAAGAFRNATRQNPRDYQSFFYLGESEEQLGQHEQAIHAFDTSLEVMSSMAAGRDDLAFRQNVLNGLASAIAKSDAHDSQINSIENQAKSGNAEQWFILAKIYAYRSDADSALDAYNRAALMDPKNFFVAKEYGLYLEHLGQRPQAEVPLRRAYALDNTDVDVNNALRRLGVVPGPSLKDEDALAQPMIPKGPIPEFDLNKLGGGSGSGSNGSAAAGTAQIAPRD
jgi:cytochrome c-type biogenesis protein CcmH/NrfG